MSGRDPQVERRRCYEDLAKVRRRISNMADRQLISPFHASILMMELNVLEAAIAMEDHRWQETKDQA